MRTMTVAAWAGSACLLASAAFAGFGSTETYLPAVGRVPGKFGAQFYTTVWATNLTGAPQTFTFRLLKAGQSNPSPASFDDTLQPGETKVYENVVETKLGLSNVLGAARITSSGEIFVSERIYNQEPGDDLGKTEGLFFAGVPKSFSISAGQSASIQGIDQGGAENFRYNFALIETGGGSATVNVQIFDGSGTLLGQRSFPLSPYEQIQPGVADVVPNIATTNARITATVTSGTGSVLLAGAQLANESQDSSGFEMTFRDSLLGGGGGTAGVTSLNGLTGALTLTPGSGISITPSGSAISIAYTGGGGAGGITSVTHDASLSGAGTGASPLGIALPASLSGASTNGPIVNVTNLASSNAGIGVQATADVGVAGLARAGSATSIGVLGQGDQGVIGFTASSQGCGVCGEAATATAVSGVSSSGIGVLGQTSAIGGAGVQGSNGAAGTTGSLGGAISGVSGSAGSGGFGVMGTSTGQGGAGVQGSKGGTGNLGWLGTSSAGVEGLSTNDTAIIGTTAGPTAAGVKGKNNDTGTAGYLAGENYGVLGTSSNSNAIIGQTSHNTAAGVEGDNTVSGLKGYLGGENYGVYALGGFAGTGGKYFIEPHPSDPTKEIRYVCLEGPESGTYFRGTARIVNGFATITVPEHFRIVTSEKGLTVVATPVGALAVLAAVHQGLDRIVIQGSSDVEFNYVVNGVRKALEDHQPVGENRDFIPKTARDADSWKALPAESIRRLKANGTLNPDGTINVETARRLGWDKQESWKKAEERAAAGN